MAKKTKQRSGRSVDGPSVANAVPSSCTLRINNSTFFQWQGNGFSGCRQISFFLGFHCLWKLLPSFTENRLSTARHPMVRLTVNMSSIACEYLCTCADYCVFARVWMCSCVCVCVFLFLCAKVFVSHCACLGMVTGQRIVSRLNIPYHDNYRTVPWTRLVSGHTMSW